jgi:hypothetical protein
MTRTLNVMIFLIAGTVTIPCSAQLPSESELVMNQGEFTVKEAEKANSFFANDFKNDPDKAISGITFSRDCYYYVINERGIGKLNFNVQHMQEMPVLAIPIIDIKNGDPAATTNPESDDSHEKYYEAYKMFQPGFFDKLSWNYRMLLYQLCESGEKFYLNELYFDDWNCRTTIKTADWKVIIRYRPDGSVKKEQKKNNHKPV